MDVDRFNIGLEARTRVLGEEYVTRALAGADSFNREFQELVTEYCWGGVWGRSALTDRQRSLNNLCIVAALNRSEEFKLHFRGALRNGVSVPELKAIITQITIYCGVPAGVDSFRVAREAFAELDKK